MTLSRDPRIQAATDRRDVRAFVRLPKAIYAGDPAWAPPIWASALRYTCRRTTRRITAACCLGFPDVNVILKETGGRLFPTGALRLAFGALAPRGVRLEANYVLEDNLRIRNALEKLGMTPIKRYRVYEKGIR